MSPTKTWYNDTDKFCCSWLESLQEHALIPTGQVDYRDIEDVRKSDIRRYHTCHFFAGIGGWAHALELAGWPEDRPVWTGSCPCQPFSIGGLKLGEKDKQHLWPEFLRLIRECRPPTVFGEQVASKFGRDWLAGVQADLEALGYAFGSADLCAAGVGAPQVRQRLFWVADADIARLQRRVSPFGRNIWSDGQTDSCGSFGVSYRPPSGGWDASDWLFCRDKKWRPVEPGTFPLAHGVPARVGRLRGYGNAIVPQLAAVFVRSFLEAIDLVALPGPTEEKETDQ